MPDPYRVHQDALQDLKNIGKGGHGWVIPNGTEPAKCGGPRYCRECSLELALTKSRDRVVITEGLKIEAGDRLLLIAPPTATQADFAEMVEKMRAKFPDVDITVVAGFTGVQVHRQEPEF